MVDETNSKYAYIWNQSMWDAFVGIAKDIKDKRRKCATPRGVLNKMFRMVYEFGHRFP